MSAGYATLKRQAAAMQRQIRALAIDLDVAEQPQRLPVDLATDLGLVLDPWQREALETDARNILLLCSRQAGKSTVAAVMALHQSIQVPGSLTLAISRSERQSKLLLRAIRRLYAPLATVTPAISEGALTLELRNGSEIHALPGKEETIRGFADVDLLLIDEAARVPDDLYSSVRPMLAVSGGRLMALSTPYGKRGFFYQEWSQGGPSWHRAMVTGYEVPRIDRAWLDEERARIGNWWFRQEYLCEFVDMEDQLFPSSLVLGAVSSEIEPLFR